MKMVMKNLLAGIAIAAIGFVGYALWDEHAKAKEQALKGEKARAIRQDFIERKKAHAQAAAAAKAVETTAAPPPGKTGSEPSDEVD